MLYSNNNFQKSDLGYSHIVYIERHKLAQFSVKKNKRKLLKASGFTHKPREQLRARGVSQMTILLQKPYTNDHLSLLFY